MTARVMDDPSERDRLRAEEIADELAIRKAQRRLAREEREMERTLDELEHAEANTERGAEQEWRREHWGHEPERPPEWPDSQDDPGRRRD
jgi:hypothetical protein